MYARKQSKEERPEVLAAAIREIKFATLITAVDGSFHAAHVPMVLKEAAAGAVLESHVARANGLWKALDVARPALAVFQGPQAYISPAWYAAKAEHGKVVPTWAYVAVHAHGTLEVVNDAAWLMAHLADVTDMNEAGRPHPWALSDAPPDFIPALARGVVGLRFAVERLEGAWKLNQHRTVADQQTMVAGLEATGRPAEAAIAALVRAELARQGDGSG
jgi:transcriptional regulator